MTPCSLLHGSTFHISNCQTRKTQNYSKNVRNMYTQIRKKLQNFAKRYTLSFYYL